MRLKLNLTYLEGNFTTQRGDGRIYHLITPAPTIFEPHALGFFASAILAEGGGLSLEQAADEALECLSALL
jgi:hypothetical protein